MRYWALLWAPFGNEIKKANMSVHSINQSDAMNHAGLCVVHLCCTTWALRSKKTGLPLQMHKLCLQRPWTQVHASSMRSLCCHDCFR